MSKSKGPNEVAKTDCYLCQRISGMTWNKWLIDKCLIPEINGKIMIDGRYIMIKVHPDLCPGDLKTKTLYVSE